MTVIDKQKFDPSTTTPAAGSASSAENPPEMPSHEQTSTPNGEGMAPSQMPGKPKTPPLPVKDSSSLMNPVKRVLGTKRKFSASTDILEPRPIPGLPTTEEPNDSSMSKRLRVLESAAKVEMITVKKPSRAVHVNIRPMLGDPFTISISDDSYIFELKEMIAERTGLTLTGIILSFPGDGKMLTDDEQLVSATGITEGTTLNLTVKVSSGVEPALNFEYDFGDDDGSEEVEFYDVVYPLPDGTDSKQNEQLADFVKLLEDERSTVHVKEGTASNSSGSNGSSASSPLPMIEITLPGTYKSISRLFEDRPRRPHPADLGALDDLDSLKISNSEEEDRYHDELLKSALGPRGAEIFRSPSLTPVQEPKLDPIVSSLTGASCCASCGKRCKLAQRFECKCGKTFCPQHRYYDQHACTFDFKAKDRALVEKANPKVVKEKIEKI